MFLLYKNGNNEQLNTILNQKGGCKYSVHAKQVSK